MHVPMTNKHATPILLYGWDPHLRLNREGMSLLKKLLLPWGLEWEGEPKPWVGLWEFIWVMVAAAGLRGV